MKIYEEADEADPASEQRDLGWQLNILTFFPKKGTVLLACPTHYQENQQSSVQDSQSYK